MEKIIDKTNLDILIDLVRGYWKTLGGEESNKRLALMSRFLKKNFNDYMCVYELVQSILSHFGLKPDATNEDIYKVFEILGWRVEE